MSHISYYYEYEEHSTIGAWVAFAHSKADVVKM